MPPANLWLSSMQMPGCRQGGELEAGMISARTKAALQAAKKRGVVLGGYRGHDITAKERKAGLVIRQEQAAQRAIDLAPIVKESQAGGATSLRAIAAGLNERNIPTARGGEWSATQVARLLEDIERPFDAAA
jgi:DNA invertase Pin-like site-specific DNA recombinase